MSSEGFYLDLVITRGSDPAERRSPPGADHLAVKEAEARSKQVAGRYAVIASMEEEGDSQDRVVWTPWPRTRDSEVRPWRTLNISTFSTLKKEAFRMMSKTMIVIQCYVNAMSIMIASMGAGV